MIDPERKRPARAGRPRTSNSSLGYLCLLVLAAAIATPPRAFAGKTKQVSGDDLFSLFAQARDAVDKGVPLALPKLPVFRLGSERYRVVADPGARFFGLENTKTYARTAIVRQTGDPGDQVAGPVTDVLHLDVKGHRKQLAGAISGSARAEIAGALQTWREAEQERKTRSVLPKAIRALTAVAGNRSAGLNGSTVVERVDGSGATHAVVVGTSGQPVYRVTSRLGSAKKRTIVPSDTVLLGAIAANIPDALEQIYAAVNRGQQKTRETTNHGQQAREQAASARKLGETLGRLLGGDLPAGGERWAPAITELKPTVRVVVDRRRGVPRVRIGIAAGSNEMRNSCQVVSSSNGADGHDRYCVSSQEHMNALDRRFPGLGAGLAARYSKCSAQRSKAGAGGRASGGRKKSGRRAY